jgi:hypothetical protein
MKRHPSYKPTIDEYVSYTSHQDSQVLGVICAMNLVGNVAERQQSHTHQTNHPSELREGFVD